MNPTLLLAAASPAAFPFSDWIILAIFLVFVGATVGGAIIAVNTLRIIRAVCGLAMCCIGLAGLFYFLNSPFLALMEILIYVGAVCVTIVFAVMLAEHDEPTTDRNVRPYPILGFVAAIAIGGGIFYGLVRLVYSTVWPSITPVVKVGGIEPGSVGDMGVKLLTLYSLPFELISLVLLVAILGALVIARGGRHKE
jgi:NADH-quinone oxidoreductase subunit J